MSFRKLEKTDSKLIGDFSSKHALEVIPGPRAKFKYISVQSLARLLKEGQSNISEVVILDARYGYEFNGGHIQNAINISSEVRNFYIGVTRLDSDIIPREVMVEKWRNPKWNNYSKTKRTSILIKDE